MPFLVATEDELYRAGVYRSDHRSGPPVMLPVTPAGVTDHLLPQLAVGSYGGGAGLLDLRHLGYPPLIEARLVQSQAIDVSWLRTFGLARQMLKDSDWFHAVAKLRAKFAEGHYVWVLRFNNCITISDAQVSSSENRSKPDFLVTWGTAGISLSESDEKSVTPTYRPLESPVVETHFDKLNMARTGPPLAVSVITSFSAGNRSETIRAAHMLDVDIEYEAVAFEVAELLSRNEPLGSIRDSVLKLATDDSLAAVALLSNEPGASMRLAESIQNSLQRRVTALGVFLPELISQVDTRWGNAQKFLRLLVETARHLAQGENGTIVLTVGSRLDGVWKASTSDGEGFAANVLSTEAAVQRLLERLRPLAPEITKKPIVRIALDSEPGPLFLFNSVAAISEFCKHASADPALSQVVGLNVDVPNWAFNNDISIDWLRSSEGTLVRNRIVHAHISDHTHGHFGDAPLGSLHRLDLFAPWLNFLRSLNAEKRPIDAPTFSGFVTCELEAAPSVADVQRSLQTLKDLLGDHNDVSHPTIATSIRFELQEVFEKFQGQKLLSKLITFVGNRARDLKITNIDKGSVIVTITGSIDALTELVGKLEQDTAARKKLLASIKCLSVKVIETDKSSGTHVERILFAGDPSKERTHGSRHRKAAVESAKLLRGRVEFGIITVRQDEFEAVLRHLNGHRTVVDGRELYAFSQLKSGGEKVGVSVVRCLEQGPERAQAVAASMIADLDPKWLFLVGIAGGLPSDEFSLGDVLLCSRYHDFAVSAALEGKSREFNVGGGSFHRDVEELLAFLPALQSQLGAWSGTTDLRDERPAVAIPQRLQSSVYYGDTSWKEKVRNTLSRRFNNGSPEPRFWIGPTASSATLVKDTKLARIWMQSARAIVNVEMELSGVYAGVRFQRREEPRLLAIRGISDIVGFKRNHEWTDYACRSAAAFAFSLIRSGVTRLVGLPSIADRA